VHGKVPTTAKMGIDATIPENIPAERYKRIVYFNQGKVDLKSYLGAAENGKPFAASLKREDNVDDLVNRITRTLEKSHCFFADLLEKFPKADYRSIGSAVARLYEEGKIAQDSEGKFQLKAPEISPAA
jgi:2,5-furandicarboxylate decarboxylase 1